MISYVIPTRDRHERLAMTLERLAALGPHGGPRGGSRRSGAEVIVVDNASVEAVRCPATLSSGVPVRLIRLPENHGAAARNTGVQCSDVNSDWVVMLDDDSYPTDLGFVAALESMPADVSAVSADIRLTSGKREAGGLPEVFVGCGVAVRAAVFLSLRGYDPAFGYYAEEYDLSARMIMAGYRVAFEPGFRIEHAKVKDGRDFGTIAGRLVRNNGWAMQRYAPDEERLAELRRVRRRYRQIAEREGALAGYAAGLIELRRTLRGQPRRGMARGAWERFIGLSAAREGLQAEFSRRAFRSAAIVEAGKNAHVVVAALQELGVRIVDAAWAEARVIGTLSPGPMQDAAERTGAMMAWRVEGVGRARAAA